MDHHEAERIQAADRYWLGELAADEREQFEEHFFDCRECAEDVRAGAIFRANAKAVFRDEEKSQRVVTMQKSEEPAGWLAWLRLRPVMATSWGLASVLALTLGYQSLVVIPRLNSQLAEATAPQSYKPFALRAATRGDVPVLELSGAGGLIGLYAYPGTQDEYRSYRAEFGREAGLSQFSVLAPPPEKPGDPLGFSIFASRLPPGTYTMNLFGTDEHGSTTKIGTYRFTVRHK